MPVLSSRDIRRCLDRNPPLVEGWLDLAEQVQTNGFDLTLRDIAALEGKGVIAASNRGRQLSGLRPLAYDADGYIDLPPGIYMMTYNEIVHLPRSIMAFGRPRSSLLRCGVDVGTAVWDAGYEGRSQSLLMVHNPGGFRVQQNARVTQLVFLDLTGESEGYKGVYQRENM